MNKPDTQLVCEQIMEILLKQGFSYSVQKKSIQNAILQLRGVDERTHKRWLNALKALDYIRPNNLSESEYVLNVTKIPNLVKVLRTIPQTHLTSDSLSQSSTTTIK